MRRRELITLVGGAAVMWPLAARTQQPAAPIVGILALSPAAQDANGMAAFRKALADAGFVDGQNVVIDYRSADWHFDRFPALAAELVARRVAVIVSLALSADLAAKAATTTIPIIINSGLDPTVFDKLKGLTRADGNIALVGQGLPPLAPKRLEIIRELIPGATTIAVLVDPDEAGHAPSETAATSAAAQALAMQIQFLEARTEGEVDDVFTALTHKPADALIVSPHPFFISLRTQLVAAAKLHAIPAVYPFSEDAEVGGLISYGNSNFDIYRQMASYTARILKGEKPGDLLAMQPAKISLTINLRTAKALGLTVPQSLLARADKVIE